MPRATQVHIKQYATKAGPRWKLRWHIDRQENQEFGFADEDDAKLRANEIERELLKGQTPLSSAGRVTLSEFAAFHFRTATWLKPGTVRRYRMLVKHNVDAPITYVDPETRRKKTIYLGAMALKKITASVVHEWVLAVEQARGELERSKAYRCLSGIMTRAILEKEISEHPCKVRGASKEKVRPRPHVGDDVPWRIAQALRNHRDQRGRYVRARFAAIPIVIGYGLGARKSEIRGLRRRDVTVEMGKARVEIQRQCHWVDGVGWDEEADTKTEKSVRPIVVYEAALEALIEHMEEFMRPAEEDPEGEDLIFTGLHGGPVADTTWHDAWTQAKLDAGVNPDITLHDLRHLAATSVAKDIKDLKFIQDYLGDATVVAAMRYLEVTDESRDEVGAAMGKRFAKFAQGADDNVVPMRRTSA